MKKRSLRILSMALAASMVAGCGSEVAQTSVDAVDQSVQQIVTVTQVSTAQSSNPNDTVYVITNADGAVNKRFDHSDSALPVDIKITYKLDGVEISPEDLSGKSGHVSIRFDYTNNAKRDVLVNDETESMYVPFTVVSGLLLDDNKFSNIQVTNGKAVDDGLRTVALGISVPGLKENLKIENDKVNIPDYVEIEADVNDFSLEMTLSIVTNDVFSELGDKHIDSLDSLDESVDKLNDAMSQLLDGSATLYDGLGTLYSKIGDLSSGVNQLYEGSTQLKEGAEKVSSGASQVASGAGELTGGLEKLVSNNDTLNGAATQVFNTLLATANTQLQAAGFQVTLTIDNYNATLDALIASLDPNAVYNQAIGQVTAGVEANNDVIVSQVTAAVRSNVEAQVTAAVRAEVEANVKNMVYAGAGVDDDTFALLPAEQQEAINQTIATTVEVQMASDAVKETIQSTTDAKMADPQVQAVIDQKVEETKQGLISDNIANIQQTAAGGVSTLTTLKASLNSYNQFYTGLQTYTAGVGQAYAGAVKLSAGASELSAGAKTLYDGTVTLNDGLATVNSAMPELSSGVKQLYDGSGKLSDGLIQFNEEGIEKLTEVLSNDIEGLVNRFQASVDLAEAYKAESSESENSAIKFIYRSESIH